MSHKLSHDENRFNVCAPCGGKIKFGSKKSEFIITEKLSTLIKTHINEEFDVSDSKFPLGICATCRTTLNEYKNNIRKRTLRTMPNYINIQLPKNTRANDGVCDCYICVTGRLTSHSKVRKGRGHKKSDVNHIKQAPKKGNIDHETSPSMKICTSCFQEIGKGIQHQCNVVSEARNNIIKLVENLPEKQQEQIASTILKRKLDSCDESKRNDLSLTLSTSGSKFNVTVKPTEKKEVIFTSEKLADYQVNTGASSRQMKKMTNFLRANVGRQSVTTNNEKLSENSKSLETFYKDANYEFDIANSSEKQKRPVIWADAEELLEHVLENRNLHNNFAVKVMLDGGQNFFKICMTVMPKNYSPDERSRSLYSEGGSSAKKAKLTSVQRLILLCVVPEIKETYDNVKLLFDLTNINNISFKLVSDFKILLLINGQQTASSMYLCPYCYISLKDLKSTEENNLSNPPDENNFEINSLKVSSNCLRLKTFGDLKTDNEQFNILGKKKLAMHSHNTINAPLLQENDDTYVIEKCLIPELHILQGFVNHLFWNGLVPLVGKEKALLWPKKLNLISKNYHGEIFEGNACRKLLKESDALQDSEIYKDVGYFAIVPYISTFKAMDKVVSSCFSINEVGPNLDKEIDELKKAFRSTQVTETLKIHVLFEHLKNCLYFLENNGLGLWSEQAGESVHREFLKTWNRYKIHSMNDPSYSKKLKKAVVEFSSLRI